MGTVLDGPGTSVTLNPRDEDPLPVRSQLNFLEFTRSNFLSPLVLLSLREHNSRSNIVAPGSTGTRSSLVPDPFWRSSKSKPIFYTFQFIGILRTVNRSNLLNRLTYLVRSTRLRRVSQIQVSFRDYLHPEPSLQLGKISYLSDTRLFCRCFDDPCNLDSRSLSTDVYPFPSFSTYGLVLGFPPYVSQTTDVRPSSPFLFSVSTTFETRTHSYQYMVCLFPLVDPFDETPFYSLSKNLYNSNSTVVPNSNLNRLPVDFNPDPQFSSLDHWISSVDLGGFRYSRERVSVFRSLSLDSRRTICDLLSVGTFFF